MTLNSTNTPTNNLFPQCALANSKHIRDFYHKVIGIKKKRFDVALASRKKLQSSARLSKPPSKARYRIQVDCQPVNCRSVIVSSPVTLNALHRAHEKWNYFGYWKSELDQTANQKYKYVNASLERSPSKIVSRKKNEPQVSMITSPSQAKKTMVSTETSTKETIRGYHLRLLNDSFQKALLPPSRASPVQTRTIYHPRQCNRSAAQGFTRSRWFDQRERLILKRRAENSHSKTRIFIEKPIQFNKSFAKTGFHKPHTSEDLDFSYQHSNQRIQSKIPQEREESLEDFSTKACIKEEIRELAIKLLSKKKWGKF